MDRILFVCTGASCRSQMAAGFMNDLFGDIVTALAAGSTPKGLNQVAVRAMAEVGVDISGQKSQNVDELADQRFDWVVTVCGSAREVCPVFDGAENKIHKGFDDPPHLAAGMEDDEAIKVYRRVRDEIREFVAGYPVSFRALL